MGFYGAGPFRALAALDCSIILSNGLFTVVSASLTMKKGLSPPIFSDAIFYLFTGDLDPAANTKRDCLSHWAGLPLPQTGSASAIGR